jgi:transmembrane sensor
MSNLVNLHPREQIHEEASIWVVRIMEEELSKEQEAELEDWLSAHKEHAAALVEVATGWDELEVIKQFLQSPQPISKDAKTGFAGVNAYAIAAVLVMSVTIAWFGYEYQIFDSYPVEQEAASLASVIYETSVGEQSKVSLPDRSFVSLNTNSKISIDFSNTERKVTLFRGEVLFEVEQDQKRPFVVKAGNSTVRAVGTAFNVYLKESNGIEVVVTQGKVVVLSTPRRVGPGNDESRDGVNVELSAGEMIKIHGALETVTKIDKKELEDRVAWKSGMMIFDERPLEEVIAELGRYTEMKIVLGDSELANIKVGGYFKTGDVDALLFALTENFNVDWEEQKKNHIVLTARSPDR